MTRATCPTQTGSFQVGTKIETKIETSECQLGDGSPGTNVWSAALLLAPAK